MLGPDENTRGEGHFVWNLARQHVQVHRNIKEVTQGFAPSPAGPSVLPPLPDVFDGMLEQEEDEGESPAPRPAMTETPIMLAASTAPLHAISVDIRSAHVRTLGKRDANMLALCMMAIRTVRVRVVLRPLPRDVDRSSIPQRAKSTVRVLF